MKTLTPFLIILVFPIFSFGQYPFEKYPVIKYSKKIGWKVYDLREKENKMHWTNTIPAFFNNKESLTLQITTFGDKDTSLIRIYKDKKQIQVFVEPYAIGRNFGMLIDTLYYADINGDSLKDLKFLCWYGGCGIASLNERVIYLFQQPGEKFIKLSFIDMSQSTRPERDMDGDGNYEIITMNLDHFEKHSYFTYNLYNFSGGTLKNVNEKYDYPIMIQFLTKDNYKVTNKISNEKMKTFSHVYPDEFDLR
jgi:hypothetical protein